MKYLTRIEAGKQLARALSRYKRGDVVVCALPRGGVVLGAEVAHYLDAPIALIIPTKIGHPLSPELAIGAVTETGEPIWSESEREFVDDEWHVRQLALARTEARRRRIKYQGNQQVPNLAGKTVIIVDDGIATGLTMISALDEVRKSNPKSVVVAVPIAPMFLTDELIAAVDKLVVLHSPTGTFGAVGNYYLDFPPVEDEEVRALMGAYNYAPADEPLDLLAINALLATIDRYPVSNGEITNRARRLHSPDNVVMFFESIPRDVEFKDKTDIMLRSEEAELLMKEAAAEPDEYPESYDS